MLTFTFDKCTRRLDENGALIAAKLGMPTPIRSLGFHMTHWFNDGLDDIRLHDRALGDAEVATLYKSADSKAPTNRSERKQTKTTSPCFLPLPNLYLKVLALLHHVTRKVDIRSRCPCLFPLLS